MATTSVVSPHSGGGAFYLKPNSTDKERLRATKGHRFWGTSAGYGSKRVAPKFGG